MILVSWIGWTFYYSYAACLLYVIGVRVSMTYFSLKNSVRNVELGVVFKNSDILF